MFAERWQSRLPLPFTRAGRQAGYWRDISMRQVEVATTITFTAPRHARAFFERACALTFSRAERELLQRKLAACL